VKIDVYAHRYPVAYLDMLDGSRGTAAGTSIAKDLNADQAPADMERRLAMMNKAGVAVQVLSVSPQSPYFANEGHAVQAARYVNGVYAEVVRQGHGRFAAFAALLLPHLQAAIDEMNRALDQFGFIGVTVNTEVMGRPLADPIFNELFAEPDRRAAVVFIHPSGHIPPVETARLTWPNGAPFEETLCVLQLIAGGNPRSVSTRGDHLSASGRVPAVSHEASRCEGALVHASRRAASWCGGKIPLVRHSERASTCFTVSLRDLWCRPASPGDRHTVLAG